jgi:hypothetical protein
VHNDAFDILQIAAGLYKLPLQLSVSTQNCIHEQLEQLVHRKIEAMVSHDVQQPDVAFVEAAAVA